MFSWCKWFKKRSTKASSELTEPTGHEHPNPIMAAVTGPGVAADEEQGPDEALEEESSEAQAPTEEQFQLLPFPPPVLARRMVPVPYNVAVQFALSPSNLAILGYLGEAKEEAAGLPPVEGRALLSSFTVRNHGAGHQQVTLMLNADDAVRVTTHTACSRLWREMTLKIIQAAGMLSAFGLGAITVSESVKTLEDWGVDLKGYPIDHYVLAATVAALIHTPRVMGQPVLEAQHQLEDAMNVLSKGQPWSKRCRQLFRPSTFVNAAAVLFVLAASMGAFSTANDSWVEMDEFSESGLHVNSMPHQRRHDDTSYYGASFVIGAAKFFLMLFAYAAFLKHLGRSQHGQAKGKKQFNCATLLVFIPGLLGILGEAAFVCLSTRDTYAEIFGSHDNPESLESYLVGGGIAVAFLCMEIAELFHQCKQRDIEGIGRFLCRQNKTCRRLSFHSPNWVMVMFTGLVMSYGATHTVFKEILGDDPKFISWLAGVSGAFGAFGALRSLYGAVHHTYMTYHDDETDGAPSAKQQVQRRINRHYLERQRWRDADRSNVDGLVNLGFMVGSVLPSVTMMFTLEVPASLFRSCAISTATAGFNMATIWMDDSWHRTPGIPGARMQALQYPLVSEGMLQRCLRCPTGYALQRKNPWNKVFNALVLFALQWGVCFGVMQVVPDDVGVVSRRNLATVISTLLAPILIRTCFFAWLVHLHRSDMEATRFATQGPSGQRGLARSAEVSEVFHDIEEKGAFTPQPASAVQPPRPPSPPVAAAGSRRASAQRHASAPQPSA